MTLERESGERRWDQLASQECASLRDESTQARSAQQAILAWSIGSIAVITAGALAAPTATNVVAIRVFAFGFALPGLIIGAAFAWIGEMIRMERAGYYLRGRETTSWDRDYVARQRVETDPEAPVADTDHYPLYWENFIASAGGVLASRKQRVGYLGSALLYGWSLVSSYGRSFRRTGSSFSRFTAGLALAGSGLQWRTAA